MGWKQRNGTMNRRENDWQQSVSKLRKIEMQMTWYSVKLLYSLYSWSTICNFTLSLHFSITWLFSFFLPFIFPFSSFLYSISYSSLCALIFISTTLFSLFLSLQSKCKWQWIPSLAMSRLTSGAAAILSHEEGKISLFSNLMIPTVCVCNTQSTRFFLLYTFVKHF